ncbi:MAG: hypothetical protein ACI93T_003755 [Porticoccaceae bacterium]|jgi:hypothetical protein
MLKFLVDSVTDSGHVLGRNDTLDIPVGTIFTRIVKQCLDGDRMHLQTIEVGDVATVSLRLTNVEWYRRNIDVIPGGHTARLILTGVGIATLSSLLTEKAEREYFSLVAGPD